MSFKLPDLNYDYNALEPYIDARTMEIHHSKHHAGYTNNLNNAIAGTALEGKSIEEILSSVSATVRDTLSIRTAIGTMSRSKWVKLCRTVCHCVRLAGFVFSFSWHQVSAAVSAASSGRLQSPPQIPDGGRRSRYMASLEYNKIIRVFFSGLGLALRRPG